MDFYGLDADRFSYVLLFQVDRSIFFSYERGLEYLIRDEVGDDGLRSPNDLPNAVTIDRE